MEINSPILFIEINKSKYIFSVGEEDAQGDLKIICKFVEPIQGIEHYRITNIDLVFKNIKENIYKIEQKIDFIFKETILIINNFNCSFLNLSGFKKLNGSQILKENITFILNSLKSYLDETEDKKTILHILVRNDILIFPHPAQDVFLFFSFFTFPLFNIKKAPSLH